MCLQPAFHKPVVSAHRDWREPSFASFASEAKRKLLLWQFSLAFWMKCPIHISEGENAFQLFLSQYWQFTKFQSCSLQAVKEKPMVEVEASNFFPGLPDPIKNMRIHSARLNSVVSEYCSCSPGAKSTPKTKARAPGEVKSADNAEWITVCIKTRVMASFPEPCRHFLLLSHSEGTSQSPHRALWGLSRIPAGLSVWKALNKPKSSSDQGLKSMLPTLQTLTELLVPSLCSGRCLLAALAVCTVPVEPPIFGFSPFHGFSTRTVLSSLHSTEHYEAQTFLDTEVCIRNAGS